MSFSIRKTVNLLLPTHVYIYIYIYIYVCVCVCIYTGLFEIIVGVLTAFIHNTLEIAVYVFFFI